MEILFHPFYLLHNIFDRFRTPPLWRSACGGALGQSQTDTRKLALEYFIEHPLCNQLELKMQLSIFVIDPLIESLRHAGLSIYCLDKTGASFNWLKSEI